MSTPIERPSGQNRQMVYAVILIAIALIGGVAFYVSQQHAKAAADAQAQNNPRWQNYLKDSGKAANATQAAFEQRQKELAAKRQKQGNTKP